MERWRTAAGRRQRRFASGWAILLFLALASPAGASTAIFDVPFTVGVVPPGEDNFSSHTFHGEAGDAVMIRAVDVSFAVFRPEVHVLDPDDVLLGTADGENVGWLTLEDASALPKTGTYTIRVYDGQLTFPPPPAGGTYHLYATRAPYSNEGGSLVNGGKVSETIDLGDLDSFTFEANAGDGVRFRMVELNDTLDFNPMLRLMAPDGSLEAWGTAPRVADLRVEGWTWSTLSQTGTYTVLAFDANPASGTAGPIGTGPYEVHMARMPGARSNGYLVDGVLSSDDIELGEMDTYQIIVDAPTTASVSFTVTAGSLAPRADVYYPSGDHLSWIVPPGNGFFSFPFAGTYTFIVTDFSPDGTGSYELLANGAGEPPPAIPIPVWVGAGLAATIALLARRSTAGAGRRMR